MDKQTLSNYGWVIITVLVLAVMIALATPFGSYIKEGAKSTLTGLFESSENALNTGLSETGVALNKAEFGGAPTVGENSGNSTTPENVRNIKFCLYSVDKNDYIGNVIYQFEEGMTWQQWVVSKYQPYKFLYTTDDFMDPQVKSVYGNNTIYYELYGIVFADAPMNENNIYKVKTTDDAINNIVDNATQVELFGDEETVSIYVEEAYINYTPSGDDTLGDPLFYNIYIKYKENMTWEDVFTAYTIDVCPGPGLCIEFDFEAIGHDWNSGLMSGYIFNVDNYLCFGYATRKSYQILCDGQPIAMSDKIDTTKNYTLNLDAQWDW